MPGNRKTRLDVGICLEVGVDLRSSSRAPGETHCCLGPGGTIKCRRSTPVFPPGLSHFVIPQFQLLIMDFRAGRRVVSKWLNGKFKDGAAVKHELFATEELAIAALEKVLNCHKQQGGTVTEKVVGSEIRYEVEDSGGFVAVHWLSDVGGWG